jgi:hypothetical protein
MQEGSIEMKREIKFRAWDKAGQRMFDGWVLEGSMADNGSWGGGYFGALAFPFPNSPEGEPREGWDYKKPDEVVLMQFTGLLDKNGVEIYEGDILRADYDNLITFAGAVEFIGSGFWVLLPNGQQFMPNNGEIIGNIYENPELLEQAAA